MSLSKCTTSLLVGGMCLTLYQYHLWCEKMFLPENPPELLPFPGYKVYGYMGCSASKVEAICKKNRLLFFSPNIHTAQNYALSRTSLWSRIARGDRPVVLQIEIQESSDITEKDLWRDRLLEEPQPVTTVMPFISFYPAIPPEVQKRCDLQVRVHHIVTCEVRHSNGGICRSLQAFWK